MNDEYLTRCMTGEITYAIKFFLEGGRMTCFQLMLFLVDLSSVGVGGPGGLSVEPLLLDFFILSLT